MLNKHKTSVFAALCLFFFLPITAHSGLSDSLDSPFGYASDSYGRFTIGTGAEISEISMSINTDTLGAADADNTNAPCYRTVGSPNCMRAQQIRPFLQASYSIPSFEITDDMMGSIALGLRYTPQFVFKSDSSTSRIRQSNLNDGEKSLSHALRLSFTPQIEFDHVTLYGGVTYDFQKFSVIPENQGGNTFSLGGLGYVGGARISLDGLFNNALDGLSVDVAYGTLAPKKVLEFYDRTYSHASIGINYSLDF